MKKAKHFAGGNYFDDMRIDIAESHRRLKTLKKEPKSIKRPKYWNIAKLYFTGLCVWLGINDFLIINGIKKKWINDFTNYWSNILEGRPFWNSLDFFMLLHDYRKRQQETDPLEWGGSDKHIANWQHPKHIYATLHLTRKFAKQPIKSLNLWGKVSKGSRILEYGCSLAPYYNCYREFFTHLECNWVLADIPNFPFHYAKYLYRNDKNLNIKTINTTNYDDPLKSAGEFDVIILTTVLEHLENPLLVSEYLLDKLKPKGLFIFDYIKSDGMGLDHPNALKMRTTCIKKILDKTEIIYGNAEDINESVGLCIAKKT